jgi:hypothetical protein
VNPSTGVRQSVTFPCLTGFNDRQYARIDFYPL